MSFPIFVFVFLTSTLDLTAQPAQDPTIARVQEEILALARELNEAVLKKDRAALERIFAPEFVFVHAYGYVDDREAQITQMLGNPDPPLGCRHSARPTSCLFTAT